MVRRQAALLILAWTAAVAACLLLAPLLPQPDSPATFRVAAYGAGVVFFLLVGQLCGAMLALGSVRARWIVLGVAVSLALVIALNLARVPVASDLAKLSLGMFAGLGLARPIERPWWLLPICVFVPLADIWSVFSERGVTNAVVDKAKENPDWISWPTLATPIAGLPYEYFGRLGIVDILFLMLFLTIIARFQLGVRRGTIVLPLAFVATNVLVYEGVAIAIPALPMLCLAVLLLYGRALWHDLRAELRDR